MSRSPATHGTRRRRVFVWGWFGRANSGPMLVELLTSSPFNVNRKEAIRRLKGVAIGADEQLTCVLVELSEYGDKDRTRAESCG